MKNIVVIFLVLLIFGASCKKEGGCLYSNGKIASENRNIDDFNTIFLKDNVNLILEKSNSNSITVEAGSNIIDGIVTQVNEYGVLEIRNENSCDWIRSYDSPVNVYLNYIDIDTIEYRSIGNISTVDTLFTDTLWLNVREGAGEINMILNTNRLYCALHYGTADIVLSGKCGLSFVYSSSFGFINMIDLETGNVYMNNRSSNDIYVRATRVLGATIENVGSIYYAGNPPVVSLDKTGSGELIKLPE